jgi:hypothetical protein
VSEIPENTAINHGLHKTDQFFAVPVSATPSAISFSLSLKRVERRP